jgi:sugar lactone lactonase YvrE
LYISGWQAISEQAYLLAESLRLDAHDRSLSWVDIERGALFVQKLDPPNEIEQFQVAPLLSWAHPIGGGRFVFAAGQQVGVWDKTGILEVSSSLIPDHKRFNDGTIDGRGRIILGTLSLTSMGHDNILMMVERDGNIRTLDSDLGLSNGLAYDPASKNLFSVDSAKGVIFQRALDPTSYDYRERRIFHSFAAGIVPDGVSLSRQGDLFVALWGSSAVVVIGRSGQEVRRIRTPGMFPTSPCLSALDGTLWLGEASQPREGRASSERPGAVWFLHGSDTGIEENRWEPIGLSGLKLTED